LDAVKRAAEIVDERWKDGDAVGQSRPKASDHAPLYMGIELL
jgi:hypothetical protein